MVKWCTERIKRGLRHITALGLTLVLGLLLLPSLTWGTTVVGNAELQLWYRMRHTFQTDSFDHVEWVQWRNEAFGWLVYDPLVEEGRLFGQIDVPLVKFATLNARYRFRLDPVYMIRDRFEEIFDGDERDTLIIPENGFRDLFVDLDFEQVGPGRLSMRIGNQQIVWGESDLFRSLDIINPLRIDQNGFAGEKFDEFRTPILAIKFLYDIGTVGTWLSDLAIEPFYTPRFRNNVDHLLLRAGWRLPSHIRACLDENDREVPFDIHRCSELRERRLALGKEPVFREYSPTWMNHRQRQVPWGIFEQGQNSRTATIDFACLVQECNPDVPGQRATGWTELVKGGGSNHHTRGSGLDTSAAGFRVLAKTFFNLDFSLNYLFLRTGPNGVPFYRKPLRLYGDADLVQQLGLEQTFGPLQGDFEAGLRRCVSPGGKNHAGSSFNPATGKREGTVLVGADLRGYNDPARKLNPDGTPKPGQHGAKRPPFTFCGMAKHDMKWSHVAGFTATYNDFQYTGAIFRLEQSYSTAEPIRHMFLGTSRFTDPDYIASFNPANFNRIVARKIAKDDDYTTGVWRSMVGFDLAKAFSSLRYVPFMPRTMYENLSFFTGQWLVQNYFHNVANSICENSDSYGNAITKKEAKELSKKLGRKVRGDSQCRRYRWNHLLTFAWAGYGFFGGRLETRNAIGFEPRGQQYILFTQNWWRNFLGFRDWEISFGMSWYPHSRNEDGWSALWAYAGRDTFWFETTYYLL